MKYINNKRASKFRFDFDIGYLIKSPCRDCDDRDIFPDCLENCSIVDRIHEILSDCISTSKG